MSLVNPTVNQAMISLANQKDSRWLTLEVCREFQRTKCSRSDQECKFAHPPPHVEVQNGRVTCCFDSIKGKCQRKEPPCKYLHPPQHLREQLLQNGRNNLIMKNLQMQMLAGSQQTGMMPAVVPGLVPMGTMPPQYLHTSPYMTSANPYAAMAGLASTPTVPGLIPVSEAQGQSLNASQVQGAVQQHGAVSSIPKARADRLEVCREFQRGNCTRQPNECRFSHPPDHVTVDTTDNTVTVCMDFLKMKCSRESCRYFHPPPHLQAKVSQQRAATVAQVQAMPQMVEVLTGKKRPRDPADDLILQTSYLQQGIGMPAAQYIKRPAMADKGGVPMYAPNPGAAFTYQQAALAMQIQQQQQQQQQFIPVSFTGHPPSVPRF